uniref:Uncharacterized protein n=1 Tax=Glossina pallidipes TaxID=7398 RepID=A0A1A9ZW48_GLOPL
MFDFRYGLMHRCHIFEQNGGGGGGGNGNGLTNPGASMLKANLGLTLFEAVFVVVLVGDVIAAGADVLRATTKGLIGTIGSIVNVGGGGGGGTHVTIGSNRQLFKVTTNTIFLSAYTTTRLKA